MSDLLGNAGSDLDAPLSRKRPFRGVVIVQLITAFRLLAALAFACLAFHGVSIVLLASIYGVAMASDIIDGLIARRLEAQTFTGKILDLVSDKSLTVVSLLYASKRGIPLAPLALIAIRDVIVLGLRIVTVAGRQLLPTNRFFGGVMATIVWGTTLFLICVSDATFIRLCERIYWACAIVFTANLSSRLYSSRARIRSALISAE